MAKRKRGKKVRVEFRQNRLRPRRESDLTRAYRDDEAQDELVDAERSQSVRAKGELSRKRTIIEPETDEPLVGQAEWLPGIVREVHGLVCQVAPTPVGPTQATPPGGRAGPAATAGEGRTAWQCTVRRVLRTRLIRERSPVAVGDRVRFSDQSAHHNGDPVGVIERVEPRRSILSRRDRRGREHVIVANADQILIVASVAQPRLKPHLIDRYLVAAGKGDLRPVIAFNKWDLLGSGGGQRTGNREQGTGNRAEGTGGGGEGTGNREQGTGNRAEGTGDGGEGTGNEVDFGDEYAGPAMTVDDVVAEFEAIGYRCVRASAATGLGMDELRAELAGHMTVVAGQSGVGKSSLINRVQPGLNLHTAEVSAESEKGRHTTTLARLLPLDFGGHVVDTPGVRAFELWAVAPGELEAYFIEFVPLVAHCKFKDCHHTDEVGCAVRAAVEDGRISARRYYSYLKMLEELARERQV